MLQPICRSVRGGKAVDRRFRNAAAALRRNQPTEWPENSRCRCGVGSSLRRQISTRNSRPSTRRVSLLRACCPSVVLDGGIVRGPRRGACGGISPVRVDAHFEVPLRRLTSRPFLLQARRHTSATTRAPWRLAVLRRATLGARSNVEQAICDRFRGNDTRGCD